ncbi:N-acetylglucosamine kinase [Arthrobacter ramosus]|uniref:N-acetylglucosamine kinase n=1 Tax=Arthrobacter ramosus TaxID=1672 RepID=A0ABV5XZQ5_ARTRM|nr:BadF/BadG/BcrA/BcrD ATPase family protein [Arthrobacter ramosus]
MAFDLGQGAVRARVRSGSALECELTAPGYRPGQPLHQFLLNLANQAAQASGNSRFDIIVGGLTGLHGRSPDPSPSMRLLEEQFGTQRLILADDALTSYLGARGDKEGVIAAVGTGLVALGFGPKGRAARVDGVGAMIGDDGAGWWIGRQGLIAALSAADGRRPGSQALLDAAIGKFGPIENLPGIVAAAVSPIALVAGFASSVAEAARSGDPVAQGIWDQAAQHIATAVSAAATRAGLGPNCDYTLLGGITAAIDLLEPTLTRRLQEDFPECRRTTPAGTSLDGAEQLAELDSLDSLFPLATEARTP